jgi:uncharacterized protein YecE (DUF72 family)
MDIPQEKKRHYGFFKRTEEVDAAWSRTAEFARALGAKKILFQSPQRFVPSEEHVEDLKQFFKKIEKDSFTLIWEPRGQWENKDVEKLCQELALSPCLDPFGHSLFEGDFVYIRLHGKGGYRYTYSEGDLLELSERVKSCPEVYIMFNNLMMYKDAQRLKNLLGRERLGFG